MQVNLQFPYIYMYFCKYKIYTLLFKLFSIPLLGITFSFCPLCQRWTSVSTINHICSCCVIYDCISSIHNTSVKKSAGNLLAMDATINEERKTFEINELQELFLLFINDDRLFSVFAHQVIHIMCRWCQWCSLYTSVATSWKPDLPWPECVIKCGFFLIVVEEDLIV